ncbi:MAG: hypothetical protein ACRDGL_00785, partial [Candidatus Limnocylindrales bacterium]
SGPSGSGPSAFGPPASGPSASGPPAWTAAGWGPGRRRGVSWAGVLLVLFGGALLLQHLGSPIGADGLVLAAIALGFGYAWLGAGEPWAAIPAAVFAALAASSIGQDLRLVTGSGWTPVFLGLAFLAIWAFGRTGPFRHTWAIWPAAIFLLIAAVEASDRLPGFPGAGVLWPLLFISGGLWLILRALQRPGRP